MAGVQFHENDMLGPYRIVAKLGEGGMGQVYKAFHTRLDKCVAIKVIFGQDKISQRLRDRFLNEARLMVRLHHPNIVAIHDIGREREIDYIVMEFIAGRPLTKKMQGDLPLREAVAILHDVTMAVDYAHEQGVIHRDLKPDNIMLREPDEMPKVMDFGLAKDTRQTIVLTNPGDLLGTPQYMAPEQARGEIREISPRTDVYALGAILYEMLTQRSAVDGRNPMQVLYNITHQEIVPPAICNASVPQALSLACMRALSREAAQRYATAREFAEAIAPFASRSANSDGKHATSRMRKTRRSPRKASNRMLVVACAACVLLGTGLGLWLSQGRLATGKTRRVEEATKPAPHQTPHAHPPTARHPGQPPDFVPKPPDFVPGQPPNFVPKPPAILPGQLVPPDKLPQPHSKLPTGMHDVDEKARGEAVRCWQQGYLLAQQHKYQEAEQLFRQAIKICPQFANAHVSLGVILGQSGKLEAAVESLLQGIRLAPDYAEAYSNLGCAYLRLNKLPEARQSLERAISMDAKDWEAHANLGSLYFKLGQLKDAARMYFQVLSLQPDNVIAHTNLGAIYAQTQRWKPAIDELTKALAIDPTMEDALYNLDVLCGMWKKELQSLSARPSLAHESISYHLFQLYLQINKPQPALEIIQRMVQLCPDSKDWHNSLGVFYYQQKQYAQAIAAYQQLVAMGTNDANIYNCLGMCYQENGQATEALAAYRQAVSLAPRFLFAYHNMGASYCSLGRWQEAISAFNKAIAIEPKHAEAYFALGQLYDRLGDGKQAVFHLKRYLQFKTLGVDSEKARAIILKWQ